MPNVIRNLDGVEKADRAIALGAFDGVHIGHRELIKTLLWECDKKALRPSVFTFSYPEGLGFNRRPIEHDFLMTEEEKIGALAQLGVEDIFIIAVNDEFTHLRPFEFLDRVIRKDLGGKILAIGEDGRFGYKGEGDVQFLLEYSKGQPLQAMIMGDVYWQEEKVSSTRIREALWAGNIEDATAMMTRPFCLTGTVISGQKLGTTLGFPTANMRYPKTSTLVRRGVYQTRVRVGDQSYPAVTSVGVAPSVHRDLRELLVESYLYDFSGNLYGETMSVEFLSFVRDEFDFGTVAELKDKIDEDLRTVRALHAI